MDNNIKETKEMIDHITKLDLKNVKEISIHFEEKQYNCAVFPYPKVKIEFFEKK